MEKKNPKIDRKKQALLVLPLLMIPFLTLAFWALGGGKGEAGSQSTASELNLQLPGAKLKESDGESKMSFYDQAEKDSAKAGKGQGRDLSFKPGTEDSSATAGSSQNSSLAYNPYPTNKVTYNDPNEEKVYKKLAELNQQISASSNRYNERKPSNEGTPNIAETATSNIIAAEKLTAGMQDPANDNGEDSEMHHLNSMMDKILDIQHPERVKERIIQSSNSGAPANRVRRGASKLASVSILGRDTSRPAKSNGFFSMDHPVSVTEENNAVEAVVHGPQTLVEGGTIKLRLLQDVSINDQVIPKDNFVFGAVSLNGERLEVSIQSVRVGRSLYGVKLHLFDMDGREGISIPGAVTREVAKGSAENAAQMLEVTSLDPSLKAQATSAGLSAVKTLLSKKAKLVRVSVKGGYKVLLKNVGNS